MTLSQLIKQTKAAQDLILMPRVYEWMADSGGEIVLRPEVAERFASMMVEVPRHRSGSISPSSAGTCPRRQILGYLGVPVAYDHDWRTKAIFADGRFRHLRWQMIGLNEGWFTDIEVSAADPSISQLGSIDAVNDDEGWLFELKGTSMPLASVRAQHAAVMAGDYEEGPVVAKWMLQIHRYLLARPQYTRAVLMVEHKATQELAELDFEPVPAETMRALAEVEVLNQALTLRQLPPMLPPCTLPEGEEWMRCPYRGDTCSQAVWPKIRRRAVKLQGGTDAPIA